MAVPSMTTKSRRPTRVDVSDLTRLRMVLGRLGRILRQQTDDDLSYPQISLLFAIERLAPVTPSALAASEGVTAPSVTRSLERLQRLGLIDRKTSASDGRVSMINLTLEGHEECMRIRHSRDVWLSEHLARLSPDEVAELVRMIPVLSKLCDPELPDTP
jgi:DNA-binding MarR family transcriptional regulator